MGEVDTPIFYYVSIHAYSWSDHHLHFPAQNMWIWRSPDAHLSKKEHNIQAVQWQEHQKVCTIYLST